MVGNRYFVHSISDNGSHICKKHKQTDTDSHPRMSHRKSCSSKTTLSFSLKPRISILSGRARKGECRRAKSKANSKGETIDATPNCASPNNMQSWGWGETGHKHNASCASPLTFRNGQANQTRSSGNENDNSVLIESLGLGEDLPQSRTIPILLRDSEYIHYSEGLSPLCPLKNLDTNNKACPNENSKSAFALSHANRTSLIPVLAHSTNPPSTPIVSPTKVHLTIPDSNLFPKKAMGFKSVPKQKAPSKLILMMNTNSQESQWKELAMDQNTGVLTSSAGQRVYSSKEVIKLPEMLEINHSYDTNPSSISSKEEENFILVCPDALKKEKQAAAKQLLRQRSVYRKVSNANCVSLFMMENRYLVDSISDNGSRICKKHKQTDTDSHPRMSHRKSCSSKTTLSFSLRPRISILSGRARKGECRRAKSKANSMGETIDTTPNNIQSWGWGETGHKRNALSVLG